MTQLIGVQTIAALQLLHRSALCSLRTTPMLPDIHVMFARWYVNP
jgi:hypothetical protein